MKTKLVMQFMICGLFAVLFCPDLSGKDPKPSPIDLPQKIALTETVVELNIGEIQKITLSNSSQVEIKLLNIMKETDPAVNALRRAIVKLQINGKMLILISGNYQLPVTFENIQIDAPVIKDYVVRSGHNSWGIQKDVRFRLWPKGAPWMTPGTFVYPIRQKLLASSTQMNNEPVYVDGGERPGSKTQYYHYGLDFGGAEGCVEAICAADALVVSAAGQTLTDYKTQPVEPRYDVIYLLDGRGWFYRYSHLMRIDVKPGQKVQKGDLLGILGKEGGSGGWSHLHFGILTNQTGLWGNHQAWPYVWEAWINEKQPALTAVARPHRVGVIGQPLQLSGELSFSLKNKNLDFEWILSNGEKKSGPTTQIVYSQPGYYSEILKVTDTDGNIAFDNTQVEIFDPKTFSDRKNDRFLFPASIHLAYAPTENIKTGSPITFKVRSFRTKRKGETIDFGDGSKPVHLMSDGNTDQHNPNGYAVITHSFERPGIYIVRADHKDQNGLTATSHVFVNVK